MASLLIQYTRIEPSPVVFRGRKGYFGWNDGEFYPALLLINGRAIL